LASPARAYVRGQQQRARFIDIQNDPANARSDATTVWPLGQLADLLVICKRVAEATGRN
jgi:3-deoxy-D-manno-octulosonic acid (KDO) 8-phosphate synthase